MATTLSRFSLRYLDVALADFHSIPALWKTQWWLFRSSTLYHDSRNFVPFVSLNVHCINGYKEIS